MTLTFSNSLVWLSHQLLLTLSCPPDALLVSTTSKECRDSDADLDVDGDDTLEYGRAQYPSQERSQGNTAAKLDCANQICRFSERGGSFIQVKRIFSLIWSSGTQRQTSFPARVKTPRSQQPSTHPCFLKMLPYSCGLSPKSSSVSSSSSSSLAVPDSRPNPEYSKWSSEGEPGNWSSCCG